MKKQLDFILKGGLTKRYHTWDTTRQQNVAEHSFFVAWLLMLMYGIDEVSEYVLVHALAHDISEGAVGDVASPVKRAMPELKKLLDKAEDAAFKESGLPFDEKATDEERRQLKMADNMEGLMFCRVELNKGNQQMQEVYDNYHSYIVAMKPVGKELKMFKLLGGHYERK